MVNYKQGNYKEALEHLNQTDPDYVYDQYWKAKTLQMTGETEKAKELFKEIANYNFNSIDYALIRNEAKNML